MEKKKNFMVKKLEIHNYYKNKKVLLTGHTGFKGSWLTIWLLSLGCKIVGVSKDIPTNPSNFKDLNIKRKIKHYTCEVENFEKIKKIIIREKPEIIFHLAAQSLVSESFRNPLKTVSTNTLGSLNVIHAASFLQKKCLCIMVTSDKCYLNLEKNIGYTEKSQLGGEDLYSGSKACAEIILRSYFLSKISKNKKLKFCTGRAGNVVGGGDWSKNRLIPDLMKAWKKNKKVIIKNPNSIRPWQHVLEPIFGYLKLAFYLNSNESLNGQSFNFGPDSKRSFTVLQLVREIQKKWGKKNSYTIKSVSSFNETKILKLNSSKAYKKLKWKSVLKLDEIAEKISEWYKSQIYKKQDLYDVTVEQIKSYEKKCFFK